MKQMVSKIWLMAVALLSTPTISMAEGIELKSLIEDATVTFYALDGGSKGSQITSVSVDTKYILADIQPAQGRWTHVKLISGLQNYANIGDASVRTRSETETGLVTLDKYGSVEAFGEIGANGSGLYKLGLNAIEGAKYIALDGITVEQISLDTKKVNIKGKDYYFSLDNYSYGYISFTYSGEAQAPVVNSISLEDLDDVFIEFDVISNIEIVLKQEDSTIDESKLVGDYEMLVSAKDGGCFKGTKTIYYRIEKAALTITAENKEKTYGADNPEWTFSYSGFVNGETEEVLTVKPYALLNVVNAGTYDIVPTGVSASNYTISYVNGTLTINKATLTATAEDVSLKQGEENPTTFVINYSGWVNGDSETALTTPPTATTNREPSSEPGVYEITVSGGEAANYEFVYVKGKLTVTEAAVTLTAKSYTIKYGDPIPAFEYEATEGITVNGTPKITCEATSTSNVGTYDIIIEKGSVTNYNVTYVKGTLTIEKAPLTAKAKSISVEQGVATPTLEIEYEGFKNNETEAVLDTKPTASTTRDKDSNPGSYDITVNGGEDNNYQITTQNGTLTVTAPAKVTVTVTSCERKYGEENSTFAYTVSGGTLSGEPEIACTATKTSAPGEYDITIEKGTIANYSYELVPGKLTVKPAQLTVTAENKTKAYGEALPELTYTITGFVNDETDDVVTTKPTITTTATAASDAGEYPITVEGAAAANYDITYVAGKLTVTGKSLTLNVSLTPSSYAYDGGVKTPTVTVTAADNTTITEADYVLGGDLSATNAGSYTITATPKGNYSGSAASANWTIEPSTTTDTQGNSITEDGTNVTLESASSNDIADDGGLTVPNGITQISSTAFSSIVDKSSVEYVDLSNTSVSGVTVDRQSGVFNGFSDNTIIYMPSGNTAAEDEPNVVIGGTCQELVLTEGEGMEIPAAFNASKVTYNRTLTAEKAGTICLPYSLTSDATVGYYQLSSSTAEALVFTEVTTTTANEPYLVVPKTAGASLSKTLSTAISSNKNLSAETDITGFKMVGTMKAIDHAAAIGKYILQNDNKWHKVTDASAAAAAIGAYHAYIEGTGAARLAIILDGSDGTTALRGIQTVDADGTERWYDLNGRRLQGKPTQKGAYIVNGKKIVK